MVAAVAFALLNAAVTLGLHWGYTVVMSLLCVSSILFAMLLLLMSRSPTFTSAAYGAIDVVCVPSMLLLSVSSLALIVILARLDCEIVYPNRVWHRLACLVQVEEDVEELSRRNKELARLVEVRGTQDKSATKRQRKKTRRWSTERGVDGTRGEDRGGGGGVEREDERRWRERKRGWYKRKL